MRLISTLTAILMATSICNVWAQTTAQPASAPTPYALTTEQSRVRADAVAAFRSQRYPEAFGRFAKLADSGHAPSAEAALFMLQNSLLLFGSDWDASAQQWARWQALVINSARERRYIPNSRYGE